MILTLGSPLLIGIFLGIPACGGFIGGTVLTGIPFSFFWAQSGRIWTTVKLSIETGKLEGKGTLTHAAALTGDWVGDSVKGNREFLINCSVEHYRISRVSFHRFFWNN